MGISYYKLENIAKKMKNHQNLKTNFLKNSPNPRLNEPPNPKLTYLILNIVISRFHLRYNTMEMLVHLGPLQQEVETITQGRLLYETL